MIFGVTGHQRLSRDEGWANIRRRLRTILETTPAPLVGLSSLAVGSDQVFAEEVVRAHGELRVVLPFPGYEDRLAPGYRPAFRALLIEAKSTLVLPRLGSDEESYLAAGTYIVDQSEVLVAVWDGRPAKGVGGTADIVEYARRRGVIVRLVDASRWR